MEKENEVVAACYGAFTTGAICIGYYFEYDTDFKEEQSWVYLTAVD